MTDEMKQFILEEITQKAEDVLDLKASAYPPFLLKDRIQNDIDYIRVVCESEGLQPAVFISKYRGLIER